MSKYVGKIITNQAPAGYSVFFDGTGDNLSLGTAAALNFGTSNFTVDFWYYPTAIGINTTILASGNATFGSGAVVISGGSTTANAMRFGAFDFGGTYQIVADPAVTPTNTWTHYALTRSGNTFTLYRNGVSVATNTWAGSVNFNSNSSTKVGGGTWDGAPSFITGNISNLRAINGTALYTANFAPPTQLFNITNTSLLTCNSPAIVDQSSNAFAITVNGNSAVSTFTPFTAYVPYNPALGASTPGVWTLDEAMQAAATRQWNMYDPSFPNTTLLLHGNGTNAAQNNTFLDSSSNNFTITRNGNTTQGSFSPFSQTGWSNYFAASALGVSTPQSQLAMGSGNFTLEYWFNSGGTTNTRAFGNGQGGVWSANRWVVAYNETAGKVQFFANNYSSTVAVLSSTSSTITSDNTWHHVAIVRSSNTWAMFIDGIRQGAAVTSSVSLDGGSAETFFISGSNITGDSPYNGYLSNARLTKGGALYDPTQTTISVPTSPLTTTVSAGTVSILTCQSNRFVDNSVNNFSVSVVLGTPSVQAFSPFYPTAAYTPQTIGGSGYFDGSGDAITAASNSAFGFTGDFTIEAWVYKGNNGSAGYDILASVGDGNAINGWFIELSTNRTPRFYSPQGLVALGSTANINDNSWHHWAFVRSGSTLTIYLDGVSQASGSVTGTINYTGSALAIGGIGTLTGGWFNGYISNFRIVRGQALTSGNFTPPKSPLTPTSVGWTGANAASSLTGTVSILTNFTNAGIVDSTAKNVLETVGNAQISTTQSKFGGSSMFFDGTGDYLLLPSSPNFAFSGDFTVEAWVYLTANIANGVGGYLTDFRVSSTNNYAFGFLGDAGVTKMYSFIGAVPASTTGTATVTLNTWNHVAYVRSGGVITMYLNGAANGTLSNSFSQGATSVTICSRFNGATEYITGYIDDLRITRFARYTAAFTPQTSQWQDQ